jgi:3-isopropylmalate/(R)-2-methylmalate dehydratase small subunit
MPWPEFPKEVKKGDIVIADKNFGCGSSREHAPLALKAAGISCVVAESFARIFYRNGFNIGLPLVESREAAASVRDGDRIRVDFATGEIEDLTQKKRYAGQPIPQFMLALVKDGGLIPHLRRKRLKAGKTPK